MNYHDMVDDVDDDDDDDEVEIKFNRNRNLKRAIEWIESSQETPQSRTNSTQKLHQILNTHPKEDQLLIQFLTFDRALQHSIHQFTHPSTLFINLNLIRFNLLFDFLQSNISLHDTLTRLSFYDPIHLSLISDKQSSESHPLQSIIFQHDPILNHILKSIALLTKSGKDIVGFENLIQILIRISNHSSQSIAIQSAKLLIQITKFSSPQLKSDEVNQIIQLFITRIGQAQLSIALEYVETLIVYGYVPSRTILIDLVRFVAIVIGLQSSDHHPDAITIQEAKNCMKNLIRSPSNQAISSLISILRDPQSQSTAIMGSIRCLRYAFEDYDSISNLDILSHHLEDHQLKTSLSLLSLGLILIKLELSELISKQHSTSIHYEILLLLVDRTRAHQSNPTAKAKSSSKSDDLDCTLDLMNQFFTIHLSTWFEAHAGSSSKALHHPLSAFANLFSILFDQFTYRSSQPPPTGHNSITITKYFRLSIGLSKYLTSPFKLTLIDQIELGKVCAPEHSHWLDNLELLLRGFFTFDHYNNHYSLPSISLPVPDSDPTAPLISLATQTRLLNLIFDIFMSTRDLEYYRDQLLKEIIFPTLTRILLLHYYPPFDDSALIVLSMDLIREILKNVLVNDLLALEPHEQPPSSHSAGFDAYDLFRKLLLRVATVGRFYESTEVNDLIRNLFQSSAPSIPPGFSTDPSTVILPTALPTSISPSKPATTITTTTISSSTPQTLRQPSQPTNHHPACLQRREALAHRSILTLIKLFQDSLSVSTAYSNLQCAAIFKDLVLLLRPAQDPHTTLPGDHSPSATSNVFSFNDLDHHLQRKSPPVTLHTPAKLAILKTLVRLRADEEHRVHFVRDLDIDGLAGIIGRVVGSVGVSDRSSSAIRVHDRKRDLTPDLNPITSPTFHHLKSRSMSVTHPAKKNSTGEDIGFTVFGRKSGISGNEIFGSSPSPSSPAKAHEIEPEVDLQLWSVPENLTEFNWPAYIQTQSTHSLVTFDHVTRRDWDPSSDQNRLANPPPTATCHHHHFAHHMTVLSISDYLAALISILRYETDWEIVSYLLCHLPGQLSNKHFACGPNASQQIHQLRRFLCSGIKLDKLLHQVHFSPRQKVKLTDAHAITYQTLSTLIAYKALFDKAQADELVGAFVTGLGKYKDTAKACVHALSLSCHELPLSITKYLPEILRGLMRIVSSAFVSVHILELLGFLGQMPTLYANLTEEEFKMIFGIALQYITNHNQQTILEAKMWSSPLKSNVNLAVEANLEADVQLAFQQYVYLMAFYVIALWFVSLKLPDRKKYVTFITRKLIQACEGKKDVDEPTEVCFDMLNRYTYSNAEPKPRKKHSKFNEIINSSLGQPVTSSSWIVGSSILTIKCLNRPGWTEVCVKRPSGMVKMIWELENLSGDHAASEYDVLDMVLRHRDTLYSAASDEGSENETRESERSDSHRTILEGFETETVISEASLTKATSRDPSLGSIPGLAKIREVNLESILGQSAEITRTTGIAPNYTNLVVEPSFFALQLLPFSDYSQPILAQSPNDFKPLWIPNQPMFQRAVDMIDYAPVVDFHKVGVIYVGPGQKTEPEILSNREGSKSYINFLSSIGTLIRLKGCEHYTTGGLDTKDDQNGKFAYMWGDDITQICFHVATLMPSSREERPDGPDPLMAKKALIGNDFVVIVFNDSGTDYKFDCLASAFNFINIIIEPNTPANAGWGGGSVAAVAGLRTELKFYKISLQRRPGLPSIGPIENFKMISSSCLSEFVRRLALHANMFVQVYLACVGTETGGVGGSKEGKPRHKMEYVSHWRARLRQIRQLKERVAKYNVEHGVQTGGGGGSARTEAKSGMVNDRGELGTDGDTPRFDVDALAQLKDFTDWTG